MLKDAIEKIQQLSDWPKHLVINGKHYIHGDLELIKPPQIPAFELMTLTGLVDVLKASVLADGAWLVHVCSHLKVVVEAKSSDEFGRRDWFADCSLQDGEQFPFNRFVDREAFVIGLQSQFVENDDSKALLKLTSSLTNGGATISEDDGISQKVTIKQGVILKDVQVVRPRWTLQPFRTFREIDQPASEFVFRVKGEPGMMPQCALFQADGGKWKLDAVLTIKQWLEAQNIGLLVIA